MASKFKLASSLLSPLRELTLLAFIFVLASCGGDSGNSSSSAGTSVTAINQGAAWTTQNQAAYYTTDQGSWVIPYVWAKALMLPNGSSFLSNVTSTYGYLPNPVSQSNPQGLPVGFLVANPGTNNEQLSMTCAACHTRQIQVSGVNYRIDGGPAFSDLYGLFQGLDQAVNYTLTNQAAFDVFQAAVQVPAATLRTQLADWYSKYHTLMGNALPTTPWGIGRADAVGMIQNRASGMDIGPAANNYMIPSNIAVAAQPVRYPFVWNSGIQDFTQWAGTNTNGNASYSLERNSGEVIGVFGHFYPQANPAVAGGVDFLAQNSTSYSGLLSIQNLVNQIGPPQWPWSVDQQLASQGWTLYNANCSSCHGIQAGAPRPGNSNTWLTEVLNVGTDSSYYKNFAIPTTSSGILSGLKVPFAGNVIPASGANSIGLVTASNVSALVQKFPSIDLSIRPPSNPTGSYESKVMQGVWAAAPYLHNGSVPTLAALLTPAAQRPTSFQVGPVYDTTNIGLATNQPGGSATVRVTTDCSTMNGNSNCGHEFGTTLTPAQKNALLEYLKIL